jgi:hypothetical protein
MFEIMNVKRMSKGIFVICFCTLFSCGQNIVEEKVETKTDSLVTVVTPEPQRENFFKDKEQEILKKYITEDWVDTLSDNMYDFADAKTDTEFEKAFLEAKRIQAALEKLIGEDADGYAVSEYLSVMDSVMSPYKAVCAGECTIFRYVFSIKALRQIAEKTKGKSDEKFCDLILMAAGEYGGRAEGYYNFFVRTWDYGGGTVLGNDFCFSFLKKSWDYIQNTPLLRKHVMTLRKICIRNMKHPIYMQKKEAVLLEVSKILDAKILTIEESESVQALKTKLENTVEGLQFDCENGDCDYGG